MGELRWRLFFYFFRCNPLKTPDSAKQMQANPSYFGFIFLLFLASNSRWGCKGPSRRSARQATP
jgi:hypothetical protein